MMSFVKISGTKATVRKEVKFSPAPVRRVDKHGRGERHIHAKVPKSWLRKLLKGEQNE